MSPETLNAGRGGMELKTIQTWNCHFSTHRYSFGIGILEARVEILWMHKREVAEASVRILCLRGTVANSQEGQPCDTAGT